MSYPFRETAGIKGEDAAARAIDQLEKQVGADNLACVVIEPILGEGGFVVPAEGFLPAIAAWCRENDVLLVADEIQSGFCRTGEWFACDHEGVVPDLITTAKGIAGGLPLAAVTGRAEIMDAVHVGGLGGTYGGNPVACAAALGAIEEMRSHDLVARARAIEALIRRRLDALAADHPVIGDIRGRGAMMAIELCAPGTTTPDAARAAAVAAYCHTSGVVVLTCGTWGNVFRFLPPLADLRRAARGGLRRRGRGVRGDRLSHGRAPTPAVGPGGLSGAEAELPARLLLGDHEAESCARLEDFRASPQLSTVTGPGPSSAQAAPSNLTLPAAPRLSGTTPGWSTSRSSAQTRHSPTGTPSSWRHNTTEPSVGSGRPGSTHWCPHWCRYARARSGPTSAATVGSGSPAVGRSACRRAYPGLRANPGSPGFPPWAQITSAPRLRA